MREGLFFLALALVFVPAGAALAAPVPEEEALKTEAIRLNDIAVEEQIDRKIEELIKKPLHAAKLIGVAKELAAKKDHPFNYNGATILGSVARELDDTNAALLFFRICVEKAQALKSERKEAVARTEVVETHFRAKQYKEAEKLAREYLELDDGNLEFRVRKPWMLRRLVQIAALQGNTDEAFRRLDPLLKAAPDDPSVLEMHGWLLRYVGKYDEAIKKYEKALADVESEKIKDIFRYTLSGLYVDMGDVDKAAGYLQDLLKRHPDNATYNNDLGYIWADHNKNIPEAEKLIRKALEKEPENPAFLDSLAWVYFRQKKYKEAKEILEKVVTMKDGQHQEIYDHLADVHMALGEKTQAIAAWRKAIEVTGTSRREEKRKIEIQKKLKELERKFD